MDLFLYYYNNTRHEALTSTLIIVKKLLKIKIIEIVYEGNDILRRKFCPKIFYINEIMIY